MKGSETKLVAYMQGADKRFVIPVYQRNYDWRTENCKQLYDDLVKVVRNKRESHFFGSIVSVYNPNANGAISEFLVIDGQQRLTTVSLLMLAMYNLLKHKVITAKTANLSEKIYEEYLVDKWKDDDTRIKLKPVKNDRLAYHQLFDSDAERIPGSNLTVNYDYFCNRIQKEEITVDELYDAIYRLEIISITLNGDDNPQLIFESLNSTGVALSEGDKIRNFILMGLPTKKQNEYYEKYWNKIEENTGYDVSSFVRDYLSVKQRVIPTQTKVYFTFKTYVEDSKIDTETLLKNLLDYAKWYHILLTGENTEDSKGLDACIYRLNRLVTTVTRPFFLEVLRLQSEGKLSIDDVTKIFLTVESYLFRRTICDLPTNSLDKIFLTLHKDILHYDGTENDYVAKLKYAILSKKERGRFPDDSEFSSAFAERQVYLMNSKNKIYILERLENYDTAEDKDVYRHIDDGVYTIEHIMPQTLSESWKKELGDDYEQIHETWLHRIANLTLTAYNSKYGNSPFSEKKTMKHGFHDSGIRMNHVIAQKENWGLPELEERSSYLTNLALGIWNSPVTDYKPAEKQLDNYSLDDDIAVKGRQISKFLYKNTEQTVTSWIDMYERVLKILHEEDKSVLSKIAYSSDDTSDLASYVSGNQADLREALQIDEGIYIESNTSTNLKISLLRRFFKLYGADPSDLTFYLRDETEDTKEDAKARIHKLRIEYWTKALDIIRSAFDGKAPFVDTVPSKQSWVWWNIGIIGISLNCIAGYKFARVEIYMGKSKKDENKKVFDSLKTHQGEIESFLGVPLVWVRGDDIRHSQVYYQLDGVSIGNETDWIQMAKFQAEWSKKFYDVLVPLITKA